MLGIDTQFGSIEILTICVQDLDMTFLGVKLIGNFFLGLKIIRELSAEICMRVSVFGRVDLHDPRRVLHLGGGRRFHPDNPWRTDQRTKPVDLCSDQSSGRNV